MVLTNLIEKRFSRNFIVCVKETRKFILNATSVPARQGDNNDSGISKTWNHFVSQSVKGGNK